MLFLKKMEDTDPKRYEMNLPTGFFYRAFHCSQFRHSIGLHCISKPFLYLKLLKNFIFLWRTKMMNWNWNLCALKY